MIPFQEVKVLDINAEHAGVPPETLMENAGRSVARVVEEKFGRSKRICVVCGTGNNAGDGLVAARYLSENSSVSLAFVKGPEKLRTSVARRNYYRVKNRVSFIDSPGELQGFDVIVDAMLGIGIAGAVREPYITWINAINGAGVPVVSVDVPSGLGTEIQVNPQVTVTFHDAKYGMAPENCGEVVVADIEIPEVAARYVGPGEFVYCNLPSKTAHKGDSGRVLVIGGGPYTGAPILSGMGAYRTGADLVYIASTRNVTAAAEAVMPEFITRTLPGERIAPADIPVILDLARGMNSLVIGPGMGRDPETISAIHTLLREIGGSVPVVIDADGLYALSIMDDFGNGTLRLNAVLTPHKGEFARLNRSGSAEPGEEDVTALAKRTGTTIVLKGKEDVISDGERTKLNLTGNPAMTVGGTGDVLAGIIGALLARGLSPFDAARLGAFISGSAGDIAFSGKSYGLTATDVANSIPDVLRKYL